MQSSANTMSDKTTLIQIIQKLYRYLKITFICSYLGRTEGETCQPGMLEVYYEIVKVV